jgi:hypothetical protein
MVATPRANRPSHTINAETSEQKYQSTYLDAPVMILKPEPRGFVSAHIAEKPRFTGVSR